ncbi:EutN/CcmL family microcompartment protein [Schlesneria paludicola]|uniref:EutN/CcmL family microcompartment protein n=1 Tax=Schlesneria paludicola TaxID=360056 RepID=UPI00029AF676|nr:EutN/CcmL family microcompartment protein [Schlesneria paludicola]
MRIGEVIGKVTLSKCDPMVSGGTWLVVVPLSVAGLKGDPAGREEPIVVYDELGASPGAKIGFSEGGEAANPFAPNYKPLDAYNACILDTIEVD